MGDDVAEDADRKSMASGGVKSMSNLSKGKSSVNVANSDLLKYDIPDSCLIELRKKT